VGEQSKVCESVVKEIEEFWRCYLSSVGWNKKQTGYTIAYRELTKQIGDIHIDSTKVKRTGTRIDTTENTHSLLADEIVVVENIESFRESVRNIVSQALGYIPKLTFEENSALDFQVFGLSADDLFKLRREFEQRSCIVFDVTGEHAEQCKRRSLKIYISKRSPDPLEKIHHKQDQWPQHIYMTITTIVALIVMYVYAFWIFKKI
jgi:hypothetical protein